LLRARGGRAIFGDRGGSAACTAGDRSTSRMADARAMSVP